MARTVKVVGAVAVLVVAVAAGTRVAGRMANGVRTAPNDQTGV
jgi:hypothetical protein